MQEEFLKENKIIEKTEIEKEEELIISILKTKRELNVARQNFEYAQGDLIDYYSYQIKANQSKLDYLIKLAKKKGIIVDIISDAKFRIEQENKAV
ncbi:MAG TPA: YaaL family protein [Clostridiaceae bacterium]|jgi:hypothetical protein|nr:YaaL family protein [Clostridiaceae bacterium]